MAEQVIAFLTGFGIAVLSHLSFVIGTAIAKYFARKEFSKERGKHDERDE